MRVSEWIQVGFALILALAAWIQPSLSTPLPIRRRWTISFLGLVPLAAVSLAIFSARWLPANTVSIVRDFLTVALFLVPYWQTGQFFQKPDHKLEQRLLTFDKWLMPRTATASGMQ